jgi:hypothetical protein
MRGRPVKSVIRQNIVELLFHIQPAHGYEIYRKYMEIFPKVTQRSIYYHLNKGKSTGELEIDKIKKEQGDYSWGSTAEKIYYKLGSKAVVFGNKEVEKFFNKKKDKKNKNSK